MVRLRCPTNCNPSLWLDQAFEAEQRDINNEECLLSPVKRIGTANRARSRTGHAQRLTHQICRASNVSMQVCNSHQKLELV